MRKLRSDSKWQRIPVREREQVLGWLAEEGMSFEIALARARSEFGIRASCSSLRRFYHHCARERELAGLALPPCNAEEFREATLKLLGSAAVTTGMDLHKPDFSKRFLPLVKMVIASQQQETKAKWLKLASRRIKKH